MSILSLYFTELACDRIVPISPAPLILHISRVLAEHCPRKRRVGLGISLGTATALLCNCGQSSSHSVLTFPSTA